LNVGIVVRPFDQSDAPRIQELYRAQKFDYAQPDWQKIQVSGVVEVDGKITMAAFLRKTSEAYLLVDQEEGRKRERLAQLLILHREMIPPMRRAGLEDCACWMPPEIAERFGKLLLHLGWVKPLWPSYSYVLPKGNENG